MKQITFYANEQEAKDFAEVRKALERNSDADTVRAMLSLTKKILLQNMPDVHNNLRSRKK